MDDSIEIREANLGEPANYKMTIRAHRSYRMVYFWLGIIEVFLAFRFFFKLLDANPRNFFAAFVYIITKVLMFPFSGLFIGKPVQTEEVQRVFDPSILVAMVVYAVLVWFLGKLILIVRSKPTSDH